MGVVGDASVLSATDRAGKVFFCLPHNAYRCFREVCHSEHRREYPGQSDTRPPTGGVPFSTVYFVHSCSSGLPGVFGFSGSMNEINEMDPTNQTNRFRSWAHRHSGVYLLIFP